MVIGGIFFINDLVAWKYMKLSDNDGYTIRFSDLEKYSGEVQKSILR